jgi:hypothetical protein
MGTIGLMIFDVVLPSVLFLFLVGMVFLYPKFNPMLNRLFKEDMKLRKRDVLLLVGVIALMITVLSLIPSLAVQILYLSLLSYSLFSFTFFALQKWYLAVVPPILFVAAYFEFWNLFTLNVFAFIFSGIIIIYTVHLFSWKTTLMFATLLTVVDVVQVFITGLMGQLAEKAVFELSLPVVIMLPTYPQMGRIILGLGDIFLAGLLVLQNTQKNGRTSGVLTALLIGLAMLIFEMVNFNTNIFRFFPATVIVLFGWLAGTGLTTLLEKTKHQTMQSKTV